MTDVPTDCTTTNAQQAGSTSRANNPSSDARAPAAIHRSSSQTALAEPRHACRRAFAATVIWRAIASVSATSCSHEMGAMPARSCGIPAAAAGARDRPLGEQEASQRLLVPHLGVPGLGLRLRVGRRHVDSGVIRQLTEQLAISAFPRRPCGTRPVRVPLLGERRAAAQEEFSIGRPRSAVASMVSGTDRTRRRSAGAAAAVLGMTRTSGS